MIKRKMWALADADIVLWAPRRCPGGDATLGPHGHHTQVLASARYQASGSMQSDSEARTRDHFI